MDVELLVIFDPANGVLVHGHPLLVCESRILLDFIQILIVLIIPLVVLINIVTLLNIYPILFVLRELFVADLASPLQLIHMLLDEVIKLCTLL